MDNKIILNDKNVLYLMKVIIDRKVINVKYFLIKEYNLNYNRYLKKLSQVKIKYPDLYLEYEKEYEKNYSLFKEDIKTIMLCMLILKKYRIELKDGTFRDFDLFDFYNLKNIYFENFYKNELMPICEELINEVKYDYKELDYNYLRVMIGSACSKVLVNYEAIDLKVDKEMIYEDKNNDLTLQEKEYLISFMENINIPFTLGNYTFGAKKMIKQRNTNNNLFELNIYLDGKRNRK